MQALLVVAHRRALLLDVLEQAEPEVGLHRRGDPDVLVTLLDLVEHLPDLGTREASGRARARIGDVADEEIGPVERRRHRLEGLEARRIVRVVRRDEVAEQERSSGRRRCPDGSRSGTRGG